MPKLILIISCLFAPENKIGALRPTKLAKYLVASGHTVNVVCAESSNSDLSGYSELSRINKIYRLSNSVKNIPSSAEISLKTNRIAKKEKSAFFKNWIKNIKLFKYTYRKYLSHKKDAIFVNNFKLLIQSSEFQNVKYDVIISSFGPMASLKCGLIAKSHFKYAKWICDFRDPAVTELLSVVYKPYYFCIQRKACVIADCITSVSAGYLNRICRDEFREKAHLIPNGYDIDDVHAYENIKSNNKFTLTYVGSLYEGKRDLSPVFGALRELADENILNIGDVHINYAGNDIMFLMKQAQQYDLGHIVEDHGYLMRNECLLLQFSTRLLVLSTWNSRREEGVFPGKFIEYMLFKRPIIAVVDGNRKNSEIKKVMDAANLGVTFEAANAIIDYSILKEYLKIEYTRYINGLPANFKPNIDIIERYNYKKIAMSFEELM